MTETKIHPETGKTLMRQTHKEIVAFGSLRQEVDVHGWYPEDGSDSLHTGADLRAKNEAFKELRAAYAVHVRSIRKRLKLTQEKAGLLVGGGPRAFQKYESGKLLPSDAAIGLLEVLNEKPEVVKILEAIRSDGGSMRITAPPNAWRVEGTQKKRLKAATGGATRPRQIASA